MRLLCVKSSDRELDSLLDNKFISEYHGGSVCNEFAELMVTNKPVHLLKLRVRDGNMIAV